MKVNFWKKSNINTGRRTKMKFKFTVIILILGMFFINPLTVQAKVQLFDDELLEQIEESADACSEIAFTIYLSTFNRYKYSVNFEKGSIKLEVQGKGYKLNGVRDDFFSEPKIKEDNLKDKTGNEVKDEETEKEIDSMKALMLEELKDKKYDCGSELLSDTLELKRFSESVKPVHTKKNWVFIQKSGDSKTRIVINKKTKLPVSCFFKSDWGNIKIKFKYKHSYK